MKHLQYDGFGSGKPRTIRMTFRGLIKGGAMLEHNGRIVDLFWNKEISSLKPIS
jgi:hypothetical protein